MDGIDTLGELEAYFPDPGDGETLGMPVNFVSQVPFGDVLQEHEVVGLILEGVVQFDNVVAADGLVYFDFVDGLALEGGVGFVLSA